MPSYCAVKGCVNKTKKKRVDITYHIFPFNSDRIERWIRFCGWPDSWRPQTNQGICSVHFDDRAYDERYKLRRQLIMDAIPSIGGYRRNDVDQNCTSTIGGEIAARIGPREIIPRDISSSDNRDIVMIEDSDDDAYGYEQLQNDTVGSGMCKICHSVLMPDAKNLLQYAAMDKTYKDVVQETLNIQVQCNDDEIMRICEKCSNFIEDLHSFVILCREGLSRTCDKTPHTPTSEFQTSDDECYDYDTVSSEEPVPNQQRDFTPVIPVITIVHDKLRFMPVSHSDMKDPLSPLDTDPKEASASENVDQNHPITCSICGKVNNDNLQLLEHMNLHTKKIKYPCQYCEKVFYASRMHRNHELTHLDKLNIYMRCDECGSVYTSTKQLYVHLQLKHSTIKQNAI